MPDREREEEKLRLFTIFVAPFSAGKLRWVWPMVCLRLRSTALTPQNCFLTRIGQELVQKSSRFMTIHAILVSSCINGCRRLQLSWQIFQSPNNQRHHIRRTWMHLVGLRSSCVSVRSWHLISYFPGVAQLYRGRTGRGVLVLSIL